MDLEWKGNRSEAIRDLIRHRLVSSDHDLCLEVMALRGTPADLGQLVMSAAGV